MSSTWDTPEEEKPLKISCTRTACQLGFHYFGPRNRKKAKFDEVGKCKDCNADLVDWHAVRKRRPEDFDKTIAMLKTEWIRHHFWEHSQFSQRQLNYAKRKGLLGLRTKFEEVLRSTCTTDPGHWQYHGTKYEGVLDSARHATATCCPECVEYWHGIPQRTVPTPEQIGYLADLAMKFFRSTLPDLQEKGQYVAPIRSK